MLSELNYQADGEGSGVINHCFYCLSFYHTRPVDSPICTEIQDSLLLIKPELKQWYRDECVINLV